MSHSRHLVVTALVLVVSLCAHVGALHAAVRGAPSPGEPGRYTLTLESGGFEREALLYIPKGFKAGDKMPVVLTLHGAGGNGGTMLDKCGWAAKADEAGFIVLAPNGLPARPRQESNFFSNPTLWNSGQLRSRSPRARIDDVAFIGELLDEVQTQLGYDASRVFCTGHSNGGGMTFRLAAELSDRFAAAGTVAGQMALSNPKPEKPLPMLYILGTEDPLLPLHGGEVTSLWGTRTTGPVSDFLATWARAIGCTTEPAVISDKDDVKRVEYTSLDEGPGLTVIYLQGHGHHWPGGRIVLPERLIGPITSKLDATDTLWEFFMKVTDE